MDAPVKGFERNKGIAWGVVVLSADGTALELMNPAFARMHGYTEEELSGRPIADVIAPAEREKLPYYTRIIHEKGYHIYESMHIRKDGSVFPVLVDATAVKDDTGKVLYRAVHILDISDQKHMMGELERHDRHLEKLDEAREIELQKINAHLKQEIDKQRKLEQALRAGEAQFRELAESIADVFFSLDSNLRYTYWNRASEKLTGIPAVKALGKSLYEIFPKIKGTAIEDIYLKVLKTKRPRNISAEFRIKDRPRIFDISTYPTKQGISVFVRDVSEQKRQEEALYRSERFLQSTINALRSHIAILDESGVIIFVNEAWRRFAEANQLNLSDHGLGTNYLKVCESAEGEDAPLAQEALNGLKALLDFRQDVFTLGLSVSQSH